MHSEQARHCPCCCLTYPFLFACLLVSLLLSSIVPSAIAIGDRLDVTWGVFSGLPLTISDAQSQNWNAIDASCGTYGIRYQLNGDRALNLIFDSAGNLAGAQAAIFSQPPAAITPPYEPQSDGTWTITVFFEDPSGVCSQTSPRTPGDLGDRLTLRNGATGQYIDQPLTVDQINTTFWVQSPCFISMGTHYWSGISNNMNCSDFYPLGLMYEGGSLVTFLFANLSPEQSSRWEHPGGAALQLFFNSDTDPACLYDSGVSISTMHFFMTNPIWNTCLSEKVKLQMPMA